MPMQTTMLPYSVEHYNSLPDIDDASAALDSNEALKSLWPAFGHLFAHHEVQSTFGLMLLHKHFGLEPTEKLVNFGSTAVPWNTTGATKELHNVQASAWRWMDDGITPYEFDYDAKCLPQLSAYQDFLNELQELLVANNLQETLGLSALGPGRGDEPMAMEFTEGRAKITLPFDIAPEPDAKQSTEVLWQFGSSEEISSLPGTAGPQPLVFKKCKKACKLKSDGDGNQVHRKVHLTTKK